MKTETVNYVWTLVNLIMQAAQTNDEDRRKEIQKAIDELAAQ